MKYNLMPNRRIDGFSLIEMSLVLLIVALLLGGLMPVISNQVDQRHMIDTRKQLDEIQQALIGFTIINGRLPCPADATTPTGQVNAANVPAGSEYKNPITGSPFTCANVTGNAAWGVVPWATLGVGETDAWGRRYTYRVTTDFADAISANTFNCTPAITPAQSSFALCSSGNQTVGLTTTDTSVANGVPAIVVSHGVNGLGAYTPSGTPISSISASGDEGDNVDNNNHFVSHDFAQGSFDDIVIWISPNTLMNRMVVAGKLP
jgi:prepilin-type N-terminal cleavage/methylation domain-containing protein